MLPHITYAYTTSTLTSKIYAEIHLDTNQDGTSATLTESDTRALNNYSTPTLDQVTRQGNVATTDVALNNDLTVAGRVGIGESNPTHALHLKKSDAMSIFIDASESSTPIPRLLFRTDRTADGQTAGGIRFANNQDPLTEISIVEIRAERGTTDAHGDLYFRTSAAERMRIDENGNVGIATDTPSQELTVNGNVALTGSDATLEIRDSDSDTNKITIANINGETYIDHYNDSLFVRAGGQSGSDQVEFTGSGDLRVSQNIYVNADGEDGAGIFIKDTITTPTPILNHGVVFSANGELWVGDASGNETQISPHDSEGRYYVSSLNRFSGRALRIDLERLARWIDQNFDTDFLSTSTLPLNQRLDRTTWEQQQRQRRRKRMKRQLLLENPWEEIPIEEAWTLQPVAELTTKTVQQTRYRYDLDTLRKEAIETTHTIRVRQPTGRMRRALKPDVRFDEVSGRFYRRRTLDDITLPERLETQP